MLRPALRLSVLVIVVCLGASSTAEAGLASGPRTGEGGEQWVQLLGGAGYDQGADVAVAGDGSVYVAGTIAGGSALGRKRFGRSDAVLAKYNRRGRLRWFRVFGGGNADRAYGVAVGPDGSVYVTGETASPRFGEGPGRPGFDAFLARFSPDGREQRIVRFGTRVRDAGYDVAAGEDGSVYVAGLIGHPAQATVTSMLIARFSAEGDREWLVRRGRRAHSSAYGIAVDDANGAVYVTGDSYEQELGGWVNQGETDLLLLKFTTGGRELWVRGYGTALIDIGRGVAVSPRGGVVVAGSADMNICCGQPTAWGEMLVLRYSATGDRLWQRSERRPGFNDGNAVTVDDDGGWIYVAGSSGGEPFATGNSEIVLLKYQDNGVKHFRRRMGGAGYDTGAGVAVGESVYIAGTAGGPFGGRAGQGESDIVLLATTRGPLPTHVRTHPEETRTGVARVDSVLAALEGGRVGPVMGLLETQMVPCGVAGIIRSPACPDGVEKGTLVEALPLSCGSWGYFSPQEVRAVVRLILRVTRGLFGVQRIQGEGQAPFFPGGGYGIILAIRENVRPPKFGPGSTMPDAPDADGLLLGIGEQGITGIRFGCGDPPGSLLWKDGVWILPPVRQGS